MELYYATTYSLLEDQQILIGVYANQEIAKRELQKSLKCYDNNFKDEYVDALIAEGELELIENEIYFGKKQVEGSSKKVCLLVSYYVDYGAINYFELFTSKRELTKFCKELTENDSECENSDDSKEVNSYARGRQNELLNDGYSYYYPVMGDPEKLCLTNFVTVKMK